MDEQAIAAQQANEFAGFLNYKPTWLFRQFLKLAHRFICSFTGNQYGKTAAYIYQYVLRIFGSHPVPKKNVLYFECGGGHFFTRPAPWPGFGIFGLKNGQCFWNDGVKVPQITTFPEDMVCPFCGMDLVIHERKSCVFRLCSENLPTEKGGEGDFSEEIKNQTYPELKKWLPPYMVEGDITVRNTAMVVKDLNMGITFGKGDKAQLYRGKKIIFQFTSYSQTVQSSAGKQLLSVFCDEEPPLSFYEEQLPRLIAEDGDFLMALTPANKLTWTFDELFEQAEVYIRTQLIVDFYKSQGEHRYTERIQKTDRQTGIAVLQAASDDNPITNNKVIEELIQFKDADTMATRRYGIFKAATGRIFKDFDHNIHVINPDQYFSDGLVPANWLQARGIDVHPKTPWACGCVSLSPENEMFIWADANLSPDKQTVLEIMTEFIDKCQDYRFAISLCDPIAQTIKKDTVTIYDDMNRITLECKRQGRGTGGYWETWDTKGEYGKDQIKARLKNSRLVGRPFNNKIVKDGRTEILPTIWILNTCRTTIEHMSHWSWEQYIDSKLSVTRDDKNTPQQKYSHMNMVWEAILKHPGFRPRMVQMPNNEQKPGNQYFKVRRR